MFLQAIRPLPPQDLSFCKICKKITGLCITESSWTTGRYSLLQEFSHALLQSKLVGRLQRNKPRQQDQIGKNYKPSSCNTQFSKEGQYNNCSKYQFGVGCRGTNRTFIPSYRYGIIWLEAQQTVALRRAEVRVCNYQNLSRTGQARLDLQIPQ